MQTNLSEAKVYLVGDLDSITVDDLEIELSRENLKIQCLRNAEDLVVQARDELPAAAIVNCKSQRNEMQSYLDALGRECPRFPVLIHPRLADTLPSNEWVSAWNQPFSAASLARDTLNRVSEARERKEKISLLQDAQGGLGRRLDWFLWKQSVSSNREMDTQRLFIKSLKHSMAQGMGLGSLVTMIDLLVFASQEKGEERIVKGRMLDDLSGAAEQVRTWLERLDTVLEAMDPAETSEDAARPDFASILEHSVQEVENFRKIKNQHIVFDRLRLPHILDTDERTIGLVLRELLTNAFKYSPEQSIIHILTHSTRDRFHIGILNDVLPMEGGVSGIPSYLENRVFDPFFRANNTYDERFAGEELGFGIGLSVLQNRLARTGGLIQLSQVEDHATGKEKMSRILALVSLPIREAKVA